MVILVLDAKLLTVPVYTEHFMLLPTQNPGGMNVIDKSLDVHSCFSFYLEHHS